MNKSLKDILQNGEEQYSHQAWEQLSQRLDTALPVQKTAKFGAKGLLIAGASALFVGSGVLFFMYSGANQTKTAPTQQVVITQPSIADSKNNNDSDSRSNSTAVNKNDSQKEEVEVVTINEEVADIPTPKDITYRDLNEKWNIEETQPVNITKSSNEHIAFVLPKCKSSYCMNEIVELENTNKQKLILRNQAGQTVIEIPAGKAEKITLTEKGVYFFEKPSGETEKAFQVLHVETVDFSFEPGISYENGVPFIQLQTNVANGQWSCNNASFMEQGSTVKLYAFKKGSYEVSLKKETSNACVAQTTQQVFIEKDYDLMAVTAFDPNSTDPRNSRFLPKALELRGIGFEMQIVDHKTGAVIFRTKDASTPWDGINHNTGEFAGYYNSFIWKVFISNPLPGEKSEYRGSVSLIQKKQ